MKLLTVIFVLYFFISSSTSCQTTNSKGKSITEKNECYDLKLSNLKNSIIYQEVMAAFNDTFPFLKTKKEYFGVPEQVNNQVDEGLFFKKDSSECMLIVLQKPQSPELVFGTARMVRGFKQNTKWKFKVSMEFIFEKGYFKYYKENNFQNISKLARYNTLTEGDIKNKGCEIDEEYWFVQLKR